MHNSKEVFISFLKQYVKQGINKTNKLVTFPIRFFPNSLKLFGIPSGIEYSKNLDYIPIYSSTLLKEVIPKTIQKEIHPKFSLKYKNSPEAFVLCLDRGISTKICANLTESGRLVEKVSAQFGYKDPEAHVIFRSPQLFPEIKHHNNSVVTLTAYGQDNYFHWLFDVLPKIHLIKKLRLKPDKIYVEHRRRFQKETIDILGYKSEQIIDANQVKFVSASKLIVPSLPGASVGIIPAWVCDFLRQSFLENNFQELSSLPESCNYKHKKIYISRADASRRRIINEPELIALVESYGFAVVKLERMRFLDQVKLFKNAEVIVAPHGAGLANLVFCKKLTKIIEIFSPNYVNVCFWCLSSQVELDYYYLIGESKSLSNNNKQLDISDDIEVDLNKVKNTLDLAAISL